MSVTLDVVAVVTGVFVIVFAAAIIGLFKMYRTLLEAKKDNDASKTEHIRFQTEMTTIAQAINLHQQAHVRREEFDELKRSVDTITMGLGQMRGEMRLLTKEVQTVTSWLIGKKGPGLSPDEDSNLK